MSRVDCHIHMLLDGHYWKDAIARHALAPDEAFIHNALAAYQRQGYTYLRDGGDRWGAGKRARELAGQYGIRYRTPLSPLCRKGHYGAFIGEVYEDLGEYTALVRKMRAQGADFIKIMISGLMDFDCYGRLTEPGLSPAEVGQLIRIAHEEGMTVMAHANGASTALAAAAAGVDSIEHGAYLNEEALAAMAENGTVWVPTLSTVVNLQGKGRFHEEAVRAIASDTAQKLRLFASMGGLIACGSDAGAWAVPHGCSTELDHLNAVLGADADGILNRGNQAIMEKF